MIHTDRKRKRSAIELSIEEVRRQIIDRALIVSSIMGIIAFSISIIGRLGLGFIFTSIIELAVLVTLIIVALLRRKLSNDLKTDAIILLIIFFSLSDAFNFGLFSSARIYLVLVPFFAIFYFSLIRAILVFVISILVFLTIGFLHHNGILSLPGTYNPDLYILRIYPWIINAVHISLVGSIILLITRKFLIAYSGLIADLEESHRLISDNERNYKEIFNSTNEAIFIHNAAEGKILDVNEAMLKMYGIPSKEEALKLNVSDITWDESDDAQARARLLIQKAVNEGPQVFEWKSKRRNGELFYSEISLKNTEIGGRGRVLAVLRDITERKIAQKALEESERKFREMAELLPETIWECDISGKVSFVNKHGLEKFGKSEEDVKKGYNILSSIIPEDRERAMVNLGKLMIEQRGYGEDYTALRDDGSTFPVTIFTSVIREKEQPVGYRGIVIDVSKKTEAEKALKESEARYRTIIDAFPDIIMISDLKGNILFGNDALEKLTGIKPEDYRNPNRKPRIHPDDLDMVRSNIAELLTSEKQHTPLIENRFIDARGKEHWFSGIISKVYFENEIHLQTISRDITSKKELELELQKSEERYRTLMESLNEVIIVSDNNFIVQFVNKRFTEKLGYTPEEVIGKPGNEIFHDPEDISAIEKARQERLSKKISQYELKFKAKDGRKIEFLVNGAPILDPSGRTIASVAALIDITDKKTAERELEKYRDQLEQLVKERTEELQAANEELSAANEELYSQREELEATLNKLEATFNQLIQSEKMASLGTLSAGIAHEINNPLNFIKTGILGIQSYLEENLERHIEPLKPMTDGILTGVERAANIVASLKHYARQDNSNLMLCDIHAIIDHCLVILQNQLKHKVEVIKNYSIDAKTVLCNEGKLHQAILNILDNAVQSIQDKGLIEISTKQKNNQLIVSIRDTGIGISKEDIKKITDPFFTTKDTGEGMGLGLSITQNIIEEHKGKLTFKSELGKGTEVIISLPLMHN